MHATGLSATRILVIRMTCASFALSSFALGAWMMFAPTSFWGLVGVGGDPFVEAIYGGAIMGEGAMFALGAIWPIRYVVFLQYLVFYKSMACLAGLLVLLRMDDPPLGAWLVLGAWAFAGLTSAAVFPWPQWPTLSNPPHTEKGTVPLNEGLMKKS
ncbi:MAG: hypothetical protein WBG86_02870 [Polyangiales bacterium]